MSSFFRFAMGDTQLSNDSGVIVSRIECQNENQSTSTLQQMKEETEYTMNAQCFSTPTASMCKEFDKLKIEIRLLKSQLDDVKKQLKYLYHSKRSQERLTGTTLDDVQLFRDLELMEKQTPVDAKMKPYSNSNSNAKVEDPPASLQNLDSPKVSPSRTESKQSLYTTPSASVCDLATRDKEVTTTTSSDKRASKKSSISKLLSSVSSILIGILGSLGWNLITKQPSFAPKASAELSSDVSSLYSTPSASVCDLANRDKEITTRTSSDKRPSKKLSTPELLSSVSSVLNGILESPCLDPIAHRPTSIEGISPSFSAESINQLVRVLSSNETSDQTERSIGTNLDDVQLFRDLELMEKQTPVDDKMKPYSNSNSNGKVEDPPAYLQNSLPVSVSSVSSVLNGILGSLGWNLISKQPTSIERISPSFSSESIKSNKSLPKELFRSASSSGTVTNTLELTPSPSQSFAPKASAELSSDVSGCNKTSDQTVGICLKLTQSEPTSIHGASNNLIASIESSSSRSMPETSLPKVSLSSTVSEQSLYSTPSTSVCDLATRDKEVTTTTSSDKRPSKKSSISELLSSVSSVFNGILGSLGWNLISKQPTSIEGISPSFSSESIKSNESLPKEFDCSASLSGTVTDTPELAPSPSQSFAPKASAELSSDVSGCNKTSDQTVGICLKLTQSEPTSIHGASNNLIESSSSRSMPETSSTYSQIRQADSANSRCRYAPPRRRFVLRLIEKTNHGLSTKQYQHFKKFTDWMRKGYDRPKPKRNFLYEID